MTCVEIVEQSYLREPTVTLALAIEALEAADKAWETLPEGGDEVCAAFSVASTLWALHFSNKLSPAAGVLIERILDTMRFRASPMWRSPRHAFLDEPELRRLYFILRDTDMGAWMVK